MFKSRPQQHPGRRLEKIRGLSSIIADFDGVQGKQPAKFLVHRLNYCAVLGSPAYVWLVGGDDEEKPGSMQVPAGLNHAGEQLEGVKSLWGIRFARDDAGSVQDTIPIQEDGTPTQRNRHQTLSHFVCDCLSFGCDTRRCQTTA
jgi:hypothetical protein